jgi:hypothetical protein
MDIKFNSDESSKDCFCLFVRDEIFRACRCIFVDLLEIYTFLLLLLLNLPIVVMMNIEMTHDRV